MYFWRRGVILMMVIRARCPTKYPAKLKCIKHPGTNWRHHDQLLYLLCQHVLVGASAVIEITSRFCRHLVDTLISTVDRTHKELMDVNCKYVIGDKEIGSGHYGVVRQCTSRGEQVEREAMASAFSQSDQM